VEAKNKIMKVKGGLIGRGRGREKGKGEEG
jgi:hypothetical protein